jgi:hypothetical protein
MCCIGFVQCFAQFTVNRMLGSSLSWIDHWASASLPELEVRHERRAINIKLDVLFCDGINFWLSACFDNIWGLASFVRLRARGYCKYNSAYCGVLWLITCKGVRRTGLGRYESFSLRLCQPTRWSLHRLPRHWMQTAHSKIELHS